MSEEKEKVELTMKLEVSPDEIYEARNLMEDHMDAYRNRAPHDTLCHECEEVFKKVRKVLKHDENLRSLRRSLKRMSLPELKKEAVSEGLPGTGKMWKETIRKMLLMWNYLDCPSLKKVKPVMQGDLWDIIPDEYKKYCVKEGTRSVSIDTSSWMSSVSKWEIVSLVEKKDFKGSKIIRFKGSKSLDGPYKLSEKVYQVYWFGLRGSGKHEYYYFSDCAQSLLEYSDKEETRKYEDCRIGYNLRRLLQKEEKTVFDLALEEQQDKKKKLKLSEDVENF